MMTNILKIDEKWSVEYDPENNDRPTRLLRYGEPAVTGTETWNNLVIAMFYALLERDKALEFYADVSKYPAPFTGGMGTLWSDCGQIARDALV